MKPLHAAATTTDARCARRRGVEHHVVELGGRIPITSNRENSSNAAISTVHEPESCSSMLATTASAARPIRTDQPLPVLARRLVGVQFSATAAPRPESRSVGCHRHTQHFIQVRGRIGTDEQNAFSMVRQGHRSRARQGGLANATLAVKKRLRVACRKNSGCPWKILHHLSSDTDSHNTPTTVP